MDTWTWRNPLPTGNTLSAITYGNGQFVAVGESGTIATSTDGVSWVLRQSGTQSDLRKIAYGNGHFVTVGDSILASYDGLTWVQSPLPPLDVTFAGGQFVGLGGHVNTQNNTWDMAIFKSSDGINWVQHDAGTNVPYPLAVLGYGNGLFVAEGGGYNPATGQGESALWTSTDAVTWTQRALATKALSGFAYGNGEFVVVGYGVTTGDPGTILTSADGTNWVERSSPIGLATICFGNGQFVAVGFSRTALTSADGTNRVQRQLGTWKYNYRGIAYGNRQFVAVGYYGTIVTSADGVTWVRPQSGAQVLQLNGIAYGNGQFAAVGEEGVILTSSDGLNWGKRLSGTQSLNGVAYGKGQFVVVGGGYNDATRQYESAVLTSSNGVT